MICRILRTERLLRTRRYLAQTQPDHGCRSRTHTQLVAGSGLGPYVVWVDQPFLLPATT